MTDNLTVITTPNFTINPSIDSLNFSIPNKTTDNSTETHSFCEGHIIDCVISGVIGVGGVVINRSYH
ncbi:MAG: hypothetical protein AB8U25_04230 [Rickettsiales endosymbiont of Dermacentor nuttalli]